jgi:hypothetical protein
VPQPGEKLATFAYPENGVLDFTTVPKIVTIRADYYDGKFLRYVTESEHPFVRYPHFETSIRVRSGASGGPVFNSRGKVVGVNCRGWDFGDDVPPDDEISIIVPVAHLRGLQLGGIDVPAISVERQTLDKHPRAANPLIADLIDCGHVEVVTSAASL